MRCSRARFYTWEMDSPTSTHCSAHCLVAVKENVGHSTTGVSCTTTDSPLLCESLASFLCKLDICPAGSATKHCREISFSVPQNVLTLPLHPKRCLDLQGTNPADRHFVVEGPKSITGFFSARTANCQIDALPSQIGQIRDLWRLYSARKAKPVS
jgi:hypothetical protein